MYISDYCEVNYEEKFNIVLVKWKKFCCNQDYRKPLEYALDIIASFINMCNFYYMVAEIGDEVEIGNFNIMELYNPDCLQDNVELFDMCLQKYEDVYKSAGIEVKRFSNVDVFVTNYLCE